MKIGIMTLGCDAGKSGVSQYLLRLLREFSSMTGDVSFEVVGHPSEREIWLGEGRELPWIDAGDWHKSAMVNVAWHQAFLPALCKRRGYDVLFLPAGNRRVPVTAPCPTVGMVHDFSHLHIENKYDPLRTLYQDRVLPWMIHKLTRVLTISESSKRDIIEHAHVPDNRITIIRHGVDHAVYKPGNQDESLRIVAKRFGIRPPYVLYISRVEHPAKNHVRLIEAFERLKERDAIPHQLVLAGGDWHGADKVHRRAQSSRFTADIVFTGFAPLTDLPDLYRGADIFVFPSLYEGFGMPILEAMACGTPVACSNVSSMPEVAGDAGMLFDPKCAEAIADALAHILISDSERTRIVNAGIARAAAFTWVASAKAHIEQFSRALDGD